MHDLVTKYTSLPFDKRRKKQEEHNKLRHRYLRALIYVELVTFVNRAFSK